MKYAPCHELYSTFNKYRESEETFDVTNAHILADSKMLQNSFLQFFEVFDPRKNEK